LRIAHESIKYDVAVSCHFNCKLILNFLKISFWRKNEKTGPLPSLKILPAAQSTKYVHVSISHLKFSVENMGKFSISRDFKNHEEILFDYRNLKFQTLKFQLCEIIYTFTCLYTAHAVNAHPRTLSSCLKLAKSNENSQLQTNNDRQNLHSIGPQLGGQKDRILSLNLKNAILLRYKLSICYSQPLAVTIAHEEKINKITIERSITVTRTQHRKNHKTSQSASCCHCNVYTEFKQIKPTYSKRSRLRPSRCDSIAPYRHH
jgi:hypothetical protein